MTSFNKKLGKLLGNIKLGNFHIPIFKYVLTKMGLCEELISKF